MGADYQTVREQGVTAEDVLVLWHADAHARGRQPTVFPSGSPNAGKPAERYIDSAGRPVYVAAPPAVTRVWEAVVAQEQLDIQNGTRALQVAIGAALSWVQSLPMTVIRYAGDAGVVLAEQVRRTVESALGVPIWAILVGAGVVAYTVLRRR